MSSVFTEHSTVSDDSKVMGSSIQILGAATAKALAQVELSFRNNKLLSNRLSELLPENM